MTSRMSNDAVTSLDGATAWLNSEPLTAAALNGQVVLVSFCTYTCINWLRTVPHLRAWDEAYRNQGLVVLGVHSPEFGFEHDLDNVARAVGELHLDHPFAVDNDFRIWRAFDNHYWPALYFVDPSGVVRHSHFGENQYEQSERRIRELLIESGRELTNPGPAPVDARGAEAPADWEHLRSPETYLGQERTENFVPAGAPLSLNRWSLAGRWTGEPENVRLTEPGGQILFQFQARDLHLVMGPATRGGPVRFQVRLDGRPPGDAHGLDVDEDGHGVLVGQRLYQLIRQPHTVREHRFEITFLDAGAEAFVFTFG